MINPKDLKRLGQAILNGPTNHTTYDIYKCIQQGNPIYAWNLYRMDGDKVGAVYRPLIEKMVGCRLHGVKNCLGPFCKKK